jgi:hypothetical protein
MNNFSSGTYDANTKLFTPATGSTAYYIYEDACGVSPLSETDNTCNDIPCSWGAWVDETPANGGACLYPCSNYTKKQKAECSGSWCAMDDGSRGVVKYRDIPCGSMPCANKVLTPFPEWKPADCSKPCGTGARTRSRVCNVVPMSKTVASPSVTEAFTNRGSSSTFRNNPYDLPNFRY